MNEKKVMSKQEAMEVISDKILESVIKEAEKDILPEKFRQEAIERLQQCNISMEFIQRELKILEHQIKESNNSEKLMGKLCDLISTNKVLKTVYSTLNIRRNNEGKEE